MKQDNLIFFSFGAVFWAILIVLIFFLTGHNDAVQLERTRFAVAMNTGEKIQDKVAAYFMEWGVMPEHLFSMKDIPLFYEVDLVKNDASSSQRIAFKIDVDFGTILLRFDADQGKLANQVLMLQPFYRGGELRWRCLSQIPQLYQSQRCK